MEENEAAFCPNEEIGEGIILIEKSYSKYSFF
jgi:hypothetical protein